jgi:hypothetical protein
MRDRTSRGASARTTADPEAAQKACRDADVSQGVRECLPTEADPVGHDGDTLVEQHDGGRLLRDVQLPCRRRYRLSAARTARGGNPGRYRFYNEYELPPDYRAAKPLRIRLHGNEEDAGRGLNRAEHLRAIPPTDPDYHTHSARRVDAESVNRKLSDTLYWRRAHSVGHVAQDADLLGFGLGMNALSWHRHRKRDGLPAAA